MGPEVNSWFARRQIVCPVRSNTVTFVVPVAPAPTFRRNVT